MNYIEHEDLSWEEAAICSEYAEKVINYCRENNIDLSGPSDAEFGILEFIVKCLIAGTVSVLISTIPFSKTNSFRYWKAYVFNKIGRLRKGGRE